MARTKHVRVRRMDSSLVASARIMLPTSDDPRGGKDRPAEAWQRECWNLYDEVGELHYTGAFVRACMSRVQLRVGMVDDDGNIGPAFDDTGKALPGADEADVALAAIQSLRSSTTAGASEIMGGAGQNLFIAGEAYLLGQDLPVPQNALDGTIPARSWEIVSVEELIPIKTATGLDYERISGPGAPRQKIPDGSFVTRIWRRHPRYSELADCPVRPLRTILEELLLLTRQVRGETLSRLITCGILGVAEEIDYAPDENADDDEAEGDAFTRDLIKSISTAISDKSSAAGMVPFVLRIPLAMMEHGIKLWEFPKIGDQLAVEKRKEAVLRFAQGIDLPVEIVTGHASTSFSNAWKIDEDLFKTHIEPLCLAVVDSLTIGYLRTIITNPKLVVWYDPTDLVSHPDQSDAADQAFDRFAISYSTYRNAKGFADSDAPDEDEMRERIELKQAINPRAVGVPTDFGGEGVAVGPDTGDTGSTPTTNGGPNVGPATSGKALDAVQAAAEVALARALTAAGARLRSKANGSLSASVLRGVANQEVAATLGPEATRRISSEDALLKGEFSALRGWVAGHYGAAYAERVESWCDEAARLRLYSPSAPLPPFPVRVPVLMP